MRWFWLSVIPVMRIFMASAPPGNNVKLIVVELNFYTKLLFGVCFFARCWSFCRFDNLSNSSIYLFGDFLGGMPKQATCVR